MLTYRSAEEVAARSAEAGAHQALRVELADASTLVECRRTGCSSALLTEGAGGACASSCAADYQRTVELKDYRAPPLAAHYLRQHYSGDLPVALTVVDDRRESTAPVGWAFLTNALVLVLFFVRVPRTRSSAWSRSALPTLCCSAWAAGMPLRIATTMFASLTAGVGVTSRSILSGHAVSARVSGPQGARRHHRELRERSAETVALTAGFLVLNLSSLKPNHSRLSPGLNDRLLCGNVRHVAEAPA